MRKDASCLRGIRGALLDVDGTLLDGDDAMPGAAAALRRLRRRGVAVRLTTNTTRRPRSAIAQALCAAGIAVETDEIIVPACLARRRILGSGRPRAALLVPEPSKEDFEGVEQVATRPDWVVVGDLGPGFNFERLNEAFLWLREGARLIALQKGRFWKAGKERIVLDAGPFVAALEFAAGIEADVVGKPSPVFFELARADIGLPPPEVVCVGDSLENDCVGAARAGCRTVLVRTGSFEPRVLENARVKPDLIIASIADLFAPEAS